MRNQKIKYMFYIYRSKDESVVDISFLWETSLLKKITGMGQDLKVLAHWQLRNIWVAST